MKRMMVGAAVGGALMAPQAEIKAAGISGPKMQGGNDDDAGATGAGDKQQEALTS